MCVVDCDTKCDQLCDYDIEKSITRETSLNFKKALVTIGNNQLLVLSNLKLIVQIVRDPPAYFARRLHSTMKGPGTYDHNLMRIIVGRSEIDLKEINTEYFKVCPGTLSYF